MKKTALIIGASGLVGGQCLNELLASPVYEKVISLTRKQPETQNPKLQTLLTDFENLESISAQLKADDVYCAMGTTIAKAGSKAAFRKVDYEIPLKVAELALKNGAKKFILVSSIGANASSALLYAKVKGEIENALAKLNYETLLIFRPSVLLGDRNEKRIGEELGKFVAEKLSFLFSGPLKKYKGTPTDLLARKMVEMAQLDFPSPSEKVPEGRMRTGVRIFENEEILK